MSNLFTANRAARPREQVVRKPDFFIIGAPKAGTTSLYTYLAAHPQIFMPRIKEPYYFCSDFPDYRQRSTLITDMAGYLKLFSRATGDHLACGEASPFYLASKVAVGQILDFNPSARFIVMLRNPIELVQSLHSQAVRSLEEPVIGIEQAWWLQEARASGRAVPSRYLGPQLLQYRRIGMLGEQVARLYEQVPGERVKIVLLEDVAAEPRRVYEEVLAFLGVVSDHHSEFPRENPNQVHRSLMLAHLVMNPPFPLDILRNAYRRYVGLGTWPVRLFHRLNGKQVSRVQISHKFRRLLESEFRDDVRLLEQLIGRDLSHWIPRTMPVSQPQRCAC